MTPFPKDLRLNMVIKIPFLKYRSNCWQMFLRISVPKNFTKITRKHQRWRCFPVNIEKFSRTVYFTTLQWLLLKIVNKFINCHFIKKETLAQVFSCEFCEISKSTFFTEHLWTTTSALNNKVYFRSAITKTKTKSKCLLHKCWNNLGKFATEKWKMKFSLKNFFSKCEQICWKLWTWSHLLKKSLTENFILSAFYWSFLALKRYS